MCMLGVRGELFDVVVLVEDYLASIGSVVDEREIDVLDLVIEAEDGSVVGDSARVSIPLFVEYGGQYGTVSCEFRVTDLVGLSEDQLASRVCYVLDVADIDSLEIGVELVSFSGNFGYVLEGVRLG